MFSPILFYLYCNCHFLLCFLFVALPLVTSPCIIYYYTFINMPKIHSLCSFFARMYFSIHCSICNGHFPLIHSFHGSNFGFIAPSPFISTAISMSFLPYAPGSRLLCLRYGPSSISCIYRYDSVAASYLVLLPRHSFRGWLYGTTLTLPMFTGVRVMRFVMFAWSVVMRFVKGAGG